MLPNDNETDDKTFAIPPKTKLRYEDFKFITETSTYKIFNAKARGSHEWHTIRVLDCTKAYVNTNEDHAATLFVQELLWLQRRYPGSVFTNTFEISENGSQMACATLSYLPLSRQLNEAEKIINPKDSQTIERLLSDVLSDVEFLWRDLHLRNILDALGPENISFIKEKERFFLGNSKIYEKAQSELRNLSITETYIIEESKKKKLSSQYLSTEIRALAFAILKMKNIDDKELQSLLATSNLQTSVYDLILKSAVAQGFKDSEKLGNLIERMLSSDIQILPDLEELRMKEDERTLLATNEESKEFQSEAHRDDLNKSLAVIENSPSRPKLLVWSSQFNNTIHIAELEMKRELVNLDGAKLSKSNDNNSWTHVKEIANTKLLVSIHHQWNTSASLEVFDVSREDQINKIYSFKGVSGVTGNGDVTYNTRRGILGAICVGGKIAYHLYSVDTSKSDGIVALERNTIWYSQYSTKDENFIAGLDFNPIGETVATIDRYGTVLISDVNNSSYSFHLNMKMRYVWGDWLGRCRWSTNSDEPLLFVKYHDNLLDILDVEKKVLTLKSSIQLDLGMSTYWIDICQCNGNLLAAGGDDMNVKIFDKRESKIVQTFDGIHNGRIRCVRWSSNGSILGTASDDNTAKIVDFKTGKVFYTGNTLDENHAMSVCFI